MVFSLFLTITSIAAAHETDQFTTPAGREFADLGPFFNRWAYDLIDAGVAHANAQISRALAEGDPRKISAAQDSGTLVNAVHGQLPWSVSEIESWEWFLMSPQMRRNYPGQLVSYRELDHNIYEHAFFPLDPRICSRWFFASTIKVYGAYLGTDKIGHFTDVGASYYWAWRAARDQGASDRSAVAAAVRLGTNGPMSESGLLGTVSNGDYANGDLAANFAGLLFYRNLCEWTSIKGRPRRPMVVRDGPYWRIADQVRRDSDFFSLFISDHLDEALNPGFFDPSMRPALRAAIEKNARAILWRYRATDGSTRPRTYFESRLRELSTYWGVDYGHRGDALSLLSIGNCCFPAGAVVASGAARTPLLLSESESGAARLAAGSIEKNSLGISQGNGVNRRGERAGNSIQFHLTAMHRAASMRDAKEVAELIARGEPINQRDDFGRTPLHDAAAAGAEEVARLLLTHGAAVDAQDSYGNTPLHLACRGGHAAAAALLLQAGANVNAATRIGTTPLHEAAFSGDRRLAELLLSFGAASAARDQLGRSPRDIAARHPQHNLLDLLPAPPEQ